MTLPWASLVCLLVGALVVIAFATPLTKQPWVLTGLAMAAAVASAFFSAHLDGSRMVVVHAVAIFLLIALLLMPRLELHVDQQRPEAVALLLLAGVGTIVLATGGDLLQLVIGMETLSLSSVLLVAMGWGQAPAEAAFKYFVLAAVSLAALVYGLGLIYFSTGSVAFPDLSRGAPNLVLLAGVVLMTAGFIFELALVPLHWGALDAYTAAAPGAAGAVMALSKLGAILAIVRLAPLGGSSFLFVVGMVGLLTAVWATIAALSQREIRRLLAYSAIAHAGFLAMAAGSGDAGRPAAIFYVVVYGATAMLVFASLAGLGPEPISFAELPARLGVQRSLALCFGLMSLAGIPPLPGFWAKLALFGPTWRALGPVPTIIGIAAAVAAAVYYLAPIPDLWNGLKLPSRRAAGNAGVVLAALTVLLLTVVPGYLWSVLGA
ncbi:MAG TPA: proton-conducting transporter membrane subunit [Chloroflexota bacterium]|nr:proton-conducting transporter membrane subunit [Chloroflexota bacterium]